VDDRVKPIKNIIIQNAKYIFCILIRKRK